MWTEWCPPCKKVEPLIKTLIEEYKDKIFFVKLNTDENPQTTQKYNVMSIPMFIILDTKQRILEKFIGTGPKQKFKEKITSSLTKMNN